MKKQKRKRGAAVPETTSKTCRHVKSKNRPAIGDWRHISQSCHTETQRNTVKSKRCVVVRLQIRSQRHTFSSFRAIYGVVQLLSFKLSCANVQPLKTTHNNSWCKHLSADNQLVSIISLSLETILPGR